MLPWLRSCAGVCAGARESAAGRVVELRWVGNKIQLKKKKKKEVSEAGFLGDRKSWGSSGTEQCSVELDIELGGTASGLSLPGNVSSLLFAEGWRRYLTS